MICVFIDIILSEPDRPVRLEVGGSYTSLGKKRKAIFDRSQLKKKKKWIVERRHSLLNWLQSQREKQSARPVKSQPGGVCHMTGCFHPPAQRKRCVWSQLFAKVFGDDVKLNIGGMQIKEAAGFAQKKQKSRNMPMIALS